LVDAGAASRAARLFDDDAVLEVAGTSIAGRGEIAQVLAAREQNTDRKTLHALGGFDFEAAAEDAATANGSLVLYAGNAAPISLVPEGLARYQAAFRRDRDVWKISELRITILETADAVL
jgi:hypothetical protein